MQLRPTAWRSFLAAPLALILTTAALDVLEGAPAQGATTTREAGEDE